MKTALSWEPARASPLPRAAEGAAVTSTQDVAVAAARAERYGHRLGPVGAPAAAVQPAAGGAPIQRTKWVHDGTQWQQHSSSSTDTDPHPHPSTAHPFASKDDTYDQQTGTYHSPLLAAVDSMGQSSGAMGFYDPRAPTGFSFASGKKQQGPHTVAHITKRVAMAASVKAGRNPLHLVGSPAFPRPRVMNLMLRMRLARGRGSQWEKRTRAMRTRYINAYRKPWRSVHDASLPLGMRLAALRKGMELNPATVYNIGSGLVSASQIAGKGENRRKGATDVRRLLQTSGPLASASGLHTIDLSGATSDETSGALRMAQALRDHLRADHVAADDGASESDSEIDDLDSTSAPTKAKKKKK